MSPPERSSDDGSFAREVGTQTGKAVVLIVVAVLVAVVLLHHGTSPTTSTASSKTTATVAPPTTTGSTTSTVPLIPPAQIKLLVLNGTLTGPLAGEFTTKLKASPGYATLTPDDTTAKVASSVVYAISPQYTAEADFLAQQLGLLPSAVVTSLPSDAPVPSSEKTIANLILVVGPDLASKA